MLYNIAFQHWTAMFLPLFSPYWMMFPLFLTTFPVLLQNNRNANEKEAPFSWTFRSFQSWINTLQTVCNGTNGRYATLQRSNLPPCAPVLPSRDPRPPPQTHLQTPTLKRIFFEKFFCHIKRNIHHPPKFFSKFFSQKIFHLIKWNIHPLLKFFLKNFSLYKKRGIYHQSEIFLMMFSHYAFSSTRQNKQWNPKKNLRSNLYLW